MAEGGTLTVAPPGVLANDLDLDPGEAVTAVTAVLVAGAAAGVLILKTDGSFTYEPGEGFAGDTFTCKACDGEDYSNVATVTITLAAGPRSRSRSGCVPCAPAAGPVFFLVGLLAPAVNSEIGRSGPSCERTKTA